MLRRIFVFLILGGLVAVCSCEPVNRKFLLETARTIKCTDDEGDVSTCGTSRTINTSAPESRENQTRIGRKFGWTFLENSDDAANKVSARKRNRGYGKILVFMVAAMKGALIYGMLHGVAALAGMAAMVAKIALALAIAALIKKNDSEKVSYEIIKHPHHNYIQTHSSSIDYDHRSDYGDDEGYNHRKRRLFR